MDIGESDWRRVVRLDAGLNMLADLELLTSLAGSRPRLYVSPHAFPDIFLCDDLCCTLGGWVRNGVSNVENCFSEVSGYIRARSACTDIAGDIIFSEFEVLPF